MKPTVEQVEAGQAVYSNTTLGVYDLIVLGISNRYLWNCPSAHIEAHYSQHVSGNHLDVGVGTGYFLDRCRFASPSPRIALMDLNRNSLEFASKRISRYAPETYQQDILEPIPPGIAKFDSIGINYLIHCVPGSIIEKATVFDHLIESMNPDATVFGSTILQGGVPRNWAAKRLMTFYNKKGIFSNSADDLEGLEQALKQRFEDVAIKTIGCVALFSGRVSKRTAPGSGRITVKR